MKMMIASDIHGDAVSARKLVEIYKNSGASTLVLLGDILYHGPRNDLPDGYSPKEVISILNSIKNEILCVRGNCDSEVDQMVLDFSFIKNCYSYINADGLEIFVTHGHIYNMQTINNLKPKSLLLHGHTHIPAAEQFGDSNVYINPGSVSIPKDNSPKSYIIYENRRFSFRKLDDGEEFMFYTC